jgi:outer membrane protein
LKSRSLYLVATLMALGLPQVQAADLKIGFVNPVKVMELAPQVQDANKRLQDEFAPREREVSQAAQEIKGMEERLDRDEATMTNDEASRLRRDIMAKKRDLKRTQDEFREDYNIKRSEELDKLQKRIYKAIESLAKEDGYDLIVSDGVIYASEQVDITETVLSRLKNK